MMLTKILIMMMMVMICLTRQTFKQEDYGDAHFVDADNDADDNGTSTSTFQVRHTCQGYFPDVFILELFSLPHLHLHLC